jgi:phenylpropionate dioxygenase-like ring-hydroxylating dioxygenase large terminal subunit
MSGRFPFPPYPNGWFCIGLSSDFPAGQVTTRHHFGQDIVVWRTADGALHASDPHCPHLGAHLGHGGRVDDDRLRCPFHGWCYDAAGQCVTVPGATRVPPRASLRLWPLREQNGAVFVHHHAGGDAPSWVPPELPDEEWSAARTVLWTLRTHPQDIFENVVDTAHLAPLHGVESAAIAAGPSEDGHRLHVVLDLVADGAIVGMPGLTNEVTLDVTLHGLGHVVVQTHVRNAGIRARQCIYATPIDEERVEVRGLVNVQKLPDPATTEQVAELFFQAYVVDFAMDFPVWENKVYRERPMLSTADGPFMVYRRWARQFYTGPATSASVAVGQ